MAGFARDSSKHFSVLCFQVVIREEVCLCCEVPRPVEFRFWGCVDAEEFFDVVVCLFYFGVVLFVPAMSFVGGVVFHGFVIKWFVRVDGDVYDSVRVLWICDVVYEVA